MVTPIRVSSIYEEETRDHDILFPNKEGWNNSFSLDNQYTNTNLKSKDFKNIDLERRIFSTLKDNNVYSVYRNNIVGNVRRRERMSNYGYHSKFNTDPKHTDFEDFEGIYVIDTYSIFTEGLDTYNVVREHLLNTSNLDMSREDIDSMIRLLSEHAPNSSDSYRIRIVSFIPKTDLIKHYSLYVESLDMVFTICNPDNILHPNSKKAYDKGFARRATTYSEPNIITLDITNLDYPNKPYFIKIGNSVQKLISTVDSETPNGFNMAYKSYDANISNVSGDLDELKKFGIYETYQEAEYNGDPDIELKKEAIDLEHKKIKNSVEKMEFEMEKMKEDRKRENEKHANEMTKIKEKHKNEIELQKIAIEQKLVDLEKKITEGKLLYLKFDIDVAQIKLKSKLEQRKADKDFIFKVITNILPMFKK